MESNLKQHEITWLAWVVHFLKSHTRRWIVVVCTLAVPLLWLTLTVTLGVSRGLGLKDEGLYLLAADPPSGTASWGFPFGWHTGPLFAAVGYDVASFRTLGAFILVMTSVALGVSVSKSLTDIRVTFFSLVTVLTIITSVSGSMFYYIAMLRTPSYNWLNLVGIQIAIVATLAGTMRRSLSKSMVFSWGLVLLAGVAGFGLFLTVPAKPSTLPVLLTLSVATFLLCCGFRNAVIWTVVVLVSITIWLVLAVVTGVWPPDFLNTFLLALQMPVSISQTTVGAIQNVIGLPNDLVLHISSLSKQQLIASAVAIALVAFPIVVQKKWIGIRVTGFLLAAVTALSISGVDIPLLGEKVFVTSWPAPERTISGLLVLFSSLLLTILPGINADLKGQRNIKLRVASIFLFVSAPLIFSFGSNIGLLKQSGVAAGFLFLAALVVLSFGPFLKMNLASMSIVALVASLITINGFAAGWKNPYDTAALENQIVQTSVGSHGSELYLTRDVNSSLNIVRNAAQSHGWKVGTPLIDLTYTWHPGIPYFLGARVPNSLMMTIFGSSSSQDIFDFHLSQPYAQDFPFRKAWILTTDPDLIDMSGTNAVANALGTLSDFTGRAFPEGYDCIDSGEFTMWRPKLSFYQDPESCDLSTLQD
jgi:hypothetical protein